MTHSFMDHDSEPASPLTPTLDRSFMALAPTPARDIPTDEADKAGRDAGFVSREAPSKPKELRNKPLSFRITNSSFERFRQEAERRKDSFADLFDALMDSAGIPKRQ